MKCLVCDRQAKAKALCTKHYQQYRKYSDILPKDKERQRIDKPEFCIIEGCTSKSYAKCKCQKHYMREYREIKGR